MFCVAARIIPGVASGQFLPGRDVQFGQLSTDPQALGVRHDRPAAPQIKLATTFGKLAIRCCERKVGLIVIGRAEPALRALQGHAKFAGTLLLGGLAKRCGQIDRHALERGVDYQRAVLAVQNQLQLIWQVTGDRQRLGHVQPIGEPLQGDLSVRHNARHVVARLALGGDLCGHRAIECLGLDALATQPAGAVKTEVAFQASQLQHRVGQFQARIVGAEVHHDLWLDALGQRDIQLQLTVQRALALPSGKRAARTDGRLLKNLQAVDQVSGKITVHQQVTVLT